MSGVSARETLENQASPRENGVIAGQDWNDGSAPIRKEVRSGCCAQQQMNPTPSLRSRASVS